MSDPNVVTLYPPRKGKKQKKTTKTPTKSTETSSESKGSKKRRLNSEMEGIIEQEDWEFFLFDEQSDAFWSLETQEQERQKLFYESPLIYHQQRMKKREEINASASSGGGRMKTRSDARKIQQAEQQHQQQQFIDQYGLGGEMEEIAEESGSVSVQNEAAIVDQEKKAKRRKREGNEKKSSSKPPKSSRSGPVEQPKIAPPQQQQIQQPVEEFYNFPIHVTPSLFVYDFGEIVRDRPAYYNKLGQYWPVGYKVSRRLDAPYTQEICEYFCQIIDGNSEPLFQINFREYQPVVESTPQMAWSKVVTTFNAGYDFGMNGLELFGLNHEFIQQKLYQMAQSLPPPIVKDKRRGY